LFGCCEGDEEEEENELEEGFADEIAHLISKKKGTSLEMGFLSELW
jgi:hypothetical protein